MSNLARTILTTACFAISTGAAAATSYPVAEKSIAELRADLAAGRTTSAELVRAYEERIEQLNPRLHAVISLNPQALAQAEAADRDRRAGRALGPLSGIPILIKDNVETLDDMPTTAGSLALKANVTHRDAPVVARLRAAGAIILGKTNLSEWANIRSSHSISGWSAMGGQTRNPYGFDRNTCGSSSGSGAAAAASLAAAAVGTETDGSVTCPSSLNGLVGIKPTVGLVSRTHIVPISHSQDTAGPMARSVADAAVMLTVMAGADPADPATAGANSHKTDYAADLSPDALKGVRVGVLRPARGGNPGVDRLYENALATLARSGATLVEIGAFPDQDKISPLEQVVLMTELKSDLEAYLGTTDKGQVPTRTLADLIAFDNSHADAEMGYFAQENFDKAQATGGLSDPAYLAASAEARRRAGPEGIDKLLAQYKVSVLVAPTAGPAWLIDPTLRDPIMAMGPGGPPAVAGYPHLTVPMGDVDGLPVGLSLIGPAWSEAPLLAYGYAFETAAKARKAPTYRAATNGADAR